MCNDQGPEPVDRHHQSEISYHYDTEACDMCVIFVSWFKQVWVTLQLLHSTSLSPGKKLHITVEEIWEATNETTKMIEALLLVMSPATDSLSVQLFTDEMKEIWREQKHGVECLQDPSNVSLPGVSLREGWHCQLSPVVGAQCP